MYEVQMFDKNWSRVAVLDQYESLIWTDRYNSAGDFEISMDPTISAFDKIKLGNYIHIDGTDRYMIVEDIELNSDAKDGGKLVISGSSLESILNRRVIFDDINIDSNIFFFMESLLNNNFILPNDARKVPNLSLDRPSLIALIDYRFSTKHNKGSNVYDIVSDICKQCGIGFKITMPEKIGDMVFGLFRGRNLSGGTDGIASGEQNPNRTGVYYVPEIEPDPKMQRVVFSPKYDNLSSSNYIMNQTEEKNVSLVLGEGEGSSKKTYTYYVDENISGLDRKETSTDASSISSKEGDTTLTDTRYKELLEDKGREDILQKIAYSVFDGEVNPNVMYKYGVDFRIGDIVKIENEYGYSSSSRITEYIRSVNTSEGLREYPTFEAL